MEREKLKQVFFSHLSDSFQWFQRWSNEKPVIVVVVVVVVVAAVVGLKRFWNGIIFLIC